jgi:hypothetical protein
MAPLREARTESCTARLFVCSCGPHWQAPAAPEHTADARADDADGHADNARADGHADDARLRRCVLLPQTNKQPSGEYSACPRACARACSGSMRSSVYTLALFILGHDRQGVGAP